MATTKVGAGLVNLDQAGSTSGLKMPSGTAFAGSAEQGMIRNDTTQTSQGAGSTMQHFNGTDWKNFDNKEIITPVTDNLLYEVKAGSLTDGSNTGPVTWSDESGNGNNGTIDGAVWDTDVPSLVQTTFQPQTKEELQAAVDLWVDDNATALATYGEINSWDVSNITNMDWMFYNVDLGPRYFRRYFYWDMMDTD